jgi:hypothetical protein
MKLCIACDECKQEICTHRVVYVSFPKKSRLAIINSVWRIKIWRYLSGLRYTVGAQWGTFKYSGSFVVHWRTLYSHLCHNLKYFSAQLISLMRLTWKFLIRAFVVTGLVQFYVINVCYYYIYVSWHVIYQLFTDFSFKILYQNSVSLYWFYANLLFDELITNLDIPVWNRQFFF